MVSGIKTFFPEGDFQYNFTANRTFSRQGRRPSATSSKGVKLRSRPSTRGSQLSPEDVIALAQSPESDLVRQSFGNSLLVLQNGHRKVKPGQFVDLRRISQEPYLPPSPSHSDLPTPRLAQRLIRKISSHEMRKQASTQTGFGDDSLAKQSGNQQKGTGSWANKASSTKPQHNFYSHDSDRCVRCSEFPDIQIEGRSLSRILTNLNTAMARQYCEILGPESCPDCARTRSQRSHQRHCIETSPSAATDVYKLALVHERAPYLTMREVQRKVYDGEIRDTKEPEISVTINKRRQRDARSSKSFAKPGTASTFEPIPETEEILSNSEPDEEIRAIQYSPETSSDEDLPLVEYKKIDLEKPHKVKMVLKEGYAQSPEDSRPISTQSPIKVESPSVKSPYQRRDAEIALPVVTENLSPVNKNLGLSKLSKNRRTFTDGIVPSPDFFFDIADLADRLRKNEVTERALRRRQRENEEEFLRGLRESAAQNASPPPSEHAPDSSSVDSFEHTRSMDMTYEPPVLYENKGRYLGVKAPPAGHRASASR